MYSEAAEPQTYKLKFVELMDAEEIGIYVPPLLLKQIPNDCSIAVLQGIKALMRASGSEQSDIDEDFDRFFRECNTLLEIGPQEQMALFHEDEGFTIYTQWHNAYQREKAHAAGTGVDGATGFSLGSTPLGTDLNDTPAPEKKTEATTAFSGHISADLHALATAYALDAEYVTGDGNCFFYSLEQYFQAQFGSSFDHRTLRALVVEYALQHFKDYLPLFEDPSPDAVKANISTMGEDQVYAVEWTLLATSRLFNLGIHIIDAKPGAVCIHKARPTPIAEMVIGLQNADHALLAHYVPLFPNGHPATKEYTPYVEEDSAEKGHNWLTAADLQYILEHDDKADTTCADIINSISLLHLHRAAPFGALPVPADTSETTTETHDDDKSTEHFTITVNPYQGPFRAQMMMGKPRYPVYHIDAER